MDESSILSDSLTKEKICPGLRKSPWRAMTTNGKSWIEAERRKKEEEKAGSVDHGMNTLRGFDANIASPRKNAICKVVRRSARDRIRRGNHSNPEPNVIASG